MAKPLGNKIASAYFDNEAVKHSKRACAFAELADKAKTSTRRDRYKKKAQQEREAAIDCLEQAKILDGKGSTYPQC